MVSPVTVAAAIDMTWRLFTAARDGDLARVQSCLAAGADPNGRHLVAYGAPTQTPLEAAVSGGHATCAAALLAAGADPGTAITSQLTVLHLAAVTGSAACIQALLDAGANPSAGAPSGLTPLHFAAAAADSRCAATLLAAGASPAAVAWDNDGEALSLLRQHNAWGPLYAALAARHQLTAADLTKQEDD
ncbi:hypothetical protein ABPG77_002561 [Micractinium sp. CCAP 211/92]